MSVKTNVLHGGMVVVRAGGKRVALAESIEVTERTPLEAVDPLGTPETVEHIRVSYQVEFSMTQYRAFNASLKATGLFPKTTNPRDILEHEAIRLECHNLDGPGNVENLSNVKIEEVSRGYRKGQLTVYNIRGRATRATDEAEV